MQHISGRGVGVSWLENVSMYVDKTVMRVGLCVPCNTGCLKQSRRHGWIIVDPVSYVTNWNVNPSLHSEGDIFISSLVCKYAAEYPHWSCITGLLSEKSPFIFINRPLALSQCQQNSQSLTCSVRWIVMNFYPRISKIISELAFCKVKMVVNIDSEN